MESIPNRQNYVPPHLRNTPNSITTESTPCDRSPPSPSRGRGPLRYSGFTQEVQKTQIQTQNSFEMAEKFDELEVIEERVGINFDAYEDIPVESSGNDIPKPANSFEEIDLGKALKDNIVKRCKYVKPTPIQRHAIPVILAGRDLMACAQTGSGKTAAFCFPIIHGLLKERLLLSRPVGAVAYPLALILSPTRELSCQIYEEAKKFCYLTGVRVAVAYGGAPISKQFRSLEKGVDILVATPGRLADMIERSRVSLKMIKYLALDEADRMLDMGFEPQIRKIVERLGMPCPGLRQTMLFSATFPTEIQRLASDFLSNYIFLSVGRVGSSTDLIVQKVEYVEDMEKRNYLMNLLHEHRAKGTQGNVWHHVGSKQNALTLVFVETKRGVDALEQLLCRNGFPATAIHGDKVQFERERALRSFKIGITPILVATDVASRGLDIPRVYHVINYDLPRDIDTYVHRIGRTGRAGKSGLATALFSDKNVPIAKALAELMLEARQEVPSWLTQYAETSSFGSVSSRGDRYGHNKFGGLDFRSGDSNFSSGNDNSFVMRYADGDAEPSSGPSSDSHGYGYGYESIVAGGWE